MDTAVCPRCGTENPGPNKYCNRCGDPMRPDRCQTCGLDNEPGARYCATCGANLGANLGSSIRTGAGTFLPSPASPPPSFGGWRMPVGAEPVTTGVTTWGGARSLTYAGFWHRVGASLIDLLITLVPLLLFLVGAAVIGGEVGIAVVSVLASCYYWIGNALGGTLGKRALAIRVINDTGAPPGLGCGFVRALLPSWIPVLLTFLPSSAWSISSLFVIVQLLDLLWMLWDDQNQTLHDKMAGTFVVRADTLTAWQPQYPGLSAPSAPRQ